MNEILWTEAFGDGNHGVADYHMYDERQTSRTQANMKAEEEVKILQAIRFEVDAVKAGSKDMFVKFTAGRMAGSIARIINPPTFKLALDQSQGRAASDPGKVVMSHVDEGWRKAYLIHGFYYLAARTWQPKASDFQMLKCEIDGKEVLEFNSRTASMKSARPVLLLGYQGPTLLVKGQAVKVEPKIKDRYGREVKKGDLAIIGRGSSGVLMVGKITSISDKRTVKLKHIGSTEESSLNNVGDDQVLLLTDDLKSVLMVEKLRSL